MKKRIISFLLTVVLLASLVAVPVNANSEPTIIVSNEEGMVGSTVEVAIDLANNPGIICAQLTVNYNANALELVEVNDTGLLPGQLHTPALASPYTLTWTNGTAASDFTVNGTIVKLKFMIKEAAAIGEVYNITVSYDYDNYEIYNFNFDPITFTIQNGSVKVIEAGSSIEEGSFELSSNITANFYVDLAASHAGAKMRFTMNGNETLAEGKESGRNGLLLYQFEGISPQCMGDTIKAELILNGEVLDVIDDYSVRAYCDMLYASTANELGLSAKKFRAAKTMMADLLEYGAMSQLYRNYKTNSLVNEGITGKSTFTELEAALWDKELGESSKAGFEFVGANVWFDNEIQLYFKFIATGCTETNFSITVYDSDTDVTHEYTLSSFDVLDEENDLYGVFSEPVPVAHFGHYFTVTLNSVTVDRRGNRVVTPIQVLDYYGVNAYIFAKQNDRGANGELTNMAKLARAAYCYGESAATYDSI